MSLPLTVLARNPRINRRIHELLPLLAKVDQQKFLKKFKTEAPGQAAHSFRELILGAFLLNNGFNARHEVLIHGKTPDWVLYTDSGAVAAVVDQVTLHQMRSLDDEMNSALRTGQPWAGWLPDNVDRIYQKVQEKAQRYESLARSASIPFVVAMFGDIKASIEVDELEDALRTVHGGGVFTLLNFLSGLIYFDEQHGTYKFRYFENQHSVCPLAVSGGEV